MMHQEMQGRGSGGPATPAPASSVDPVRHGPEVHSGSRRRRAGAR